MGKRGTSIDDLDGFGGEGAREVAVLLFVIAVVIAAATLLVAVL